MDDFIKYLSENTNLSATSVEHYERGFRAASKQMLELGVIEKPLREMTSGEFERAIFIILHNPDFQKKDAVGRRMYSNSLKQFGAFLKNSGKIDEKENIAKIEGDITISKTEREALVKSRIGQGVFRQAILQKFNGKCVVTEISDARLLVASHIKPWSVSDNNDRISSENGFLLNCLYDKMFDLGLISFENTGKMLLSSSLKKTDLEILKIDDEKRYDLKNTLRQSQNLEYHRDMIFLR